MKWRKASAFHLSSECGGYVVTKYRVNGEWKYQAVKLGKPSRSLLVAGSADECKAACESDKRGKR